MINTNKPTNLLIEDMHFEKPDSEQEALISRVSSVKYKANFYKRLIISLAAALIILAAEFIARVYTNKHAYSLYFRYAGADTMPDVIIFVVSVFLIFNLLSFVFMKIKTAMNDILNKYECAYGIVTEKYDGRHLSQTSGEISHNYILFSNEEGHCTTALSVKKQQVFQSIDVGDEILVVKYKPLGTAGYTFIPVEKKTETVKA